MATAVLTHIRSGWAVRVGALALAALAACSEADLEIRPIQPQDAYVGETLRVPIRVINRTGRPLELWFNGPPLQNLDRWAHLSPRDDGGEFQWTPTSAHVGVQQFLFIATAGDERTSRTVELTVHTARESAPVFDEPPIGRAIDLAREPCLAIPIEVHDLDSETVAIGVAAGLPRGAELVETSPQSAELRWCPAPDQVAAAEQWLLTLSARDETHAPVLRDLRLLVVAPRRADCAGEPPTIGWLSPGEGEPVVSFVGYDLTMDVDDDNILRDPPLLLWTIGRLEQRDQLDLGQLEVVPFRSAGGHWVAHLPSFVLAPDEDVTVTLVPWVTDNDDPRGTRCDHRAELRTRRFVARGAIEAGVLPDCRPCAQSGDCISGVCLGAPEGGRCVPSCEDEPCEVGECRLWNAQEGVVRAACGDVRAVCEGLQACVDDALEDNDSAAAATPVAGGEAIGGTLCGRDADDFAVEVAVPSRISVALSPLGPEAGDLELRLTDAAGAIVAVSGGPADEIAEQCVLAGATLTAEVLSPTAGDNHYQLTIDQTEADCACRDDDREPDGPDGALPLVAGVPVTGAICPGDTDYFSLTGDGTARTLVELSFDASEADLDLDLTAAGAGESARVTGGEASATGERLAVDLIGAGPYRVRVFAFDGRAAAYTLAVAREPLTACESPDDCALGELCDGTWCRRVACERNRDCPAGHVCPLTDTGVSARTCLPTCADDGDCPAGERCKSFFEGAACWPEGPGLTADPCGSAGDCAGNRACIDWPGGYCAAAACDRAAVCDEAALCAVVDSRPLCVADCWLDDAICQRPEAYQCGELFAPDSELVYGCFPQER